MGSGTYTVSTAPVEARGYTKNGKDLTVWRLGLEGVRSIADDHLFELHKIKGNAPPSVGETLDVESSKEDVFNNEKFTRLFLKKTYQERGQGGGGGGGGGNPRRDQGPGLQWQNAPYNSSASHPRDEVRMIRTSALSSAPAFIEQLLSLPGSDVVPPKTWDEYWTLVGRVVVRLEEGYAARLAVYDQRVSPQQQLPEAEVPADREGLTAEQRAHDAAWPF